MSFVDIADDTYVPLPPERVAELVATSSRGRTLWTGLQLGQREDRGAEGTKYRALTPVDGRAEVWLEQISRQHGPATVMHIYVRGSYVGAGRARRYTRQQRRRIKELGFWLRQQAVQERS